jgi:hypothetical protein
MEGARARHEFDVGENWLVQAAALRLESAWRLVSGKGNLTYLVENHCGLDYFWLFVLSRAALSPRASFAGSSVAQKCI